MERKKIGQIDRIIMRPPLKMSPAKVISRAGEIYNLATTQKQNGVPDYLKMLNNRDSRWINVDVYLVERAKGLSRQEMYVKLHEFWQDKLR